MEIDVALQEARWMAGARRDRERAGTLVLVSLPMSSTVVCEDRADAGGAVFQAAGILRAASINWPEWSGTGNLCARKRER